MKPISDQSLSDEKSRHCSTLYRVQKYGDGRPINQSGVVRPPVSHLIKINAADVPVFRGHRVSAGFSPLPRSPAGNYISNRSVISPPLRQYRSVVTPLLQQQWPYLPFYISNCSVISPPLRQYHSVVRPLLQQQWPFLPFYISNRSVISPPLRQYHSEVTPLLQYSSGHICPFISLIVLLYHHLYDSITPQYKTSSTIVVAISALLYL